MDAMRKGDIRSALSWKVILILTILFVALLMLFQMGIIRKIIEGIKPILITIPW